MYPVCSQVTFSKRAKVENTGEVYGTILSINPCGDTEDTLSTNNSNTAIKIYESIGIKKGQLV